MAADPAGCGDAPANCSMTRVEIKKMNIGHKNNLQQNYIIEVIIQTSSHWLVQDCNAYEDLI